GNGKDILAILNAEFDIIAYPKEHILVETRYPEILPLFHEAGYNTSYYLPQDIHAMDKEAQENTIAEIQAVLDQQAELAISTKYSDYEILHSYFPDRPKYIWSLSHEKIGDYALIRSMLKDPTVKLVLVRYHPLF
ncbi:MAG: hypothetical protein R3359_08600, partial [Marinirhabdus sp.]|nr:hypothetical protein [Marinirhabdus sp.]